MVRHVKQRYKSAFISDISKYAISKETLIYIFIINVWTLFIIVIYTES